MKNNIETNTKYSGNVKLNLKINGKNIQINKHNNGLPDLFRLISKALAGYDISNEKPSYIDLRYMNQSGEWESCLSNKQSISQLSYNLSNGSWITKAASTIPYAALIVTPISSLGENVPFRIFLMNKRTDLAYIDVDSSDVYKITPGTQALVEWVLKIFNSD